MVEPARLGSCQDPLTDWLKRCRCATRRGNTSPGIMPLASRTTASAAVGATGSRVENTSDAVGKGGFRELSFVWRS